MILQRNAGKDGKTMKKDRNHEGYHDPTAGRAIRMANNERSQKKREEGTLYRLGELQVFKDAVSSIKKSK